MPEDLKLSQIGSSQPPPPFRGLHSPGVRKYCQITFACYFRKSSIHTYIIKLANLCLLKTVLKRLLALPLGQTGSQNVFPSVRSSPRRSETGVLLQRPHGPPAWSAASRPVGHCRHGGRHRHRPGHRSGVSGHHHRSQRKLEAQAARHYSSGSFRH